MRFSVLEPKHYAKIKVKDPKQFACLNMLWTKESNWRPRAHNKTLVNGKRAGGIPQILGLSPKLPAYKQIDRGLKYIKHRYGSPCAAWQFWQRQDMKGTGWY
jgi:hypothetical protein